MKHPKRLLGIGPAPRSFPCHQPSGHHKSQNPGSFAARGSIVREKDAAAHKTMGVETLIYRPSRTAWLIKGNGDCYIYLEVGVRELAASIGIQKAECMEAIDV